MNPAAAYRLDIAHRGSPFGSHDDQWLAIATELHYSASAPLNETRETLYSAIGLAIDLLGDDLIDSFASREWKRDLGYVEAMMVLAQLVYEAGALNLAATLLDDLRRSADDLTAVQEGRILAMRARVEWKLGHHDESLERYRYIEALGKRSHAPELVARACLGYSVLAQLKGNLPELQRHARRAVALADEHGFSSLGRVARHGLMLVAARRGHHATALVEGWRAFQASAGEAEHEAEVLQNLGQMLLECEQYTIARACFSAVFERTTLARLTVSALGGLALASARTGAEATVEWATREVWRARQQSVPSYELAAALVECAIAFAVLGRHSEAERYRVEGESRASAGGFHEIALQSEALDRRPDVAVQPLTGRARSIAGIIAAMEPEKLPNQVIFSAGRP